MSPALKRRPEAALGLMERVLRSGASIASDYPLVFSGHPGAAFVVEEHSGEARAACALLERELVVRERRIRAGLIGSVATDPAWREQGLGAAVLAEAEAELGRRGALLAILWADDPAWYEKRGWRRFGWEIDFLVPAECAGALPEPFGVRDRRPEDDAQIHALYERHPERVGRTASETSALLRCPGMEVLVLERWGKLAGYTCLGRGSDMRDVVHEWAGDAQAVLALLREHLTRRGEGDLFLIAPPSAVDVAEKLTAAGAKLAQGVVGMGKIVRTDDAARLAVALLDRRGGASWMPAEDGGVQFIGPLGEFTAKREELFDLLFAAHADRSTVQRIGGRLGTPGMELPLAPFLWGLDSI